MHALPPPNDNTSGGGQGSGARGQPGALTPIVEPFEFSRSDARLFDRAIVGRWPMSEERRARVVETLGFIVDNPDLFGARTVIMAGKALIAADKINLDVEAQVVPKPTLIDTPSGPRVDFSKFTDDELERYLTSGGQT